jgi:hypothetical protein
MYKLHYLADDEGLKQKNENGSRDQNGNRSFTDPANSLPDQQQFSFIIFVKNSSDTFDHRSRNIGHPVRSAIHKPQIG